jgi:hypothetical protein
MIPALDMALKNAVILPEPDYYFHSVTGRVSIIAFNWNSLLQILAMPHILSNWYENFTRAAGQTWPVI